MSDKPLKFFLGFIAFVYFLEFLNYLHISTVGFFLTLLLMGLCLILFLPRSLVAFLDRLLKPKNINTKASGINTIWQMAFLSIIAMHGRFWGFLTKFYPFSLLYRDRLFNAQNRNIKNFIDELEKYAREVHLPLLIESGDSSSIMSLFSAKQIGSKRMKKELYLKQLSEKLQAKYETIYLKNETSGFKIQVPTNMVRGMQA